MTLENDENILAWHKYALCETRQLDDIIHWDITNEGFRPSKQAMIAIERSSDIYPLNATQPIWSVADRF